MTMSTMDQPSGYPFAVQATSTGFAAGGLQFPAVATAPSRSDLQVLMERQTALYLLDRHLERQAPEPPKHPRDVDLSDYREVGEEPEVVYARAAPISAISVAVEEAIRDEGITYAELARRMRTPRSVVSRITDPFYFGHSARTLRRVADALGRELRVAFARPVADGEGPPSGHPVMFTV